MLLEKDLVSPSNPFNGRNIRLAQNNDESIEAIYKTNKQLVLTREPLSQTNQHRVTKPNNEHNRFKQDMPQAIANTMHDKSSPVAFKKRVATAGSLTKNYMEVELISPKDKQLDECVQYDLQIDFTMNNKKNEIASRYDSGRSPYRKRQSITIEKSHYEVLDIYINMDNCMDSVRHKKPEIDFTRRKSWASHKRQNPAHLKPAQMNMNNDVCNARRQSIIEEEDDDDVENEKEEQRKFDQHASSIAQSWRRASKIGVDNERELDGIFKQIYTRKVSVNQSPHSTTNDSSTKTKASNAMANTVYKVMHSKHM